ncbi:bifunctional oligoribonuclease/PAP phosphatase NrnA [candidate division KSB1 bacterium]|nr:bifunctional oligoribonuclease/PAP phosphatase NrnA [candidate division KSB1 bacterium]
MKRDWEQVKSIIAHSQNFVLTTHINPDGDGLGAELALATYLKSIGKKVTIVNTSPTPNNYRFLDPFREILVYEPAHQSLLKAADVFFILDISDWGRMREIGQFIRRAPQTKICIDHHHCPNTFTDYNFIDPTASSTGELIYELLIDLRVKFTKPIADAIFTCILTDTGSFRFSNTTAKAHQIAATLIEMGLNSREIYQQVYEKNSPAKIKLLGLILQRLNFENGGRLAWFNITSQMLTQSGANPWDTEGFPDFPRTIDGVEISLMFTELEERKTKISFRSKGRIAVNSVAMKLGGGGHEFASGALLDCSIREANAIVVEETKQLFNGEN